MVPGPKVHGPEVNTITRPPWAECDSATSPCRHRNGHPRRAVGPHASLAGERIRGELIEDCLEGELALGHGEDEPSQRAVRLRHGGSSLLVVRRVLVGRELQTETS